MRTVQITFDFTDKIKAYTEARDEYERCVDKLNEAVEELEEARETLDLALNENVGNAENLLKGLRKAVEQLPSEITHESESLDDLPDFDELFSEVE